MRADTMRARVRAAAGSRMEPDEVDDMAQVLSLDGIRTRRLVRLRVEQALDRRRGWWERHVSDEVLLHSCSPEIPADRQLAILGFLDSLSDLERETLRTLLDGRGLRTVAQVTGVGSRCVRDAVESLRRAASAHL